jgi:predicted amidohydrolase
MSAVVVACCQLSLRVGEVEANRARAAAAIEDAAARGARVVVLPELVNSGYVFTDRDEAAALAEPLDGPTVTEWAALARARGVVVVGGVCERADDGTLRNTAVLVDGDGLRAAYRKAHLWDREVLVFAPGAEPPPVVATAAGRIGLVVCYDLEFPEWVRLPTLAGAELLCAPVNWPRGARPPEGERPGEVVRVQAAASCNRIWIAACDRVHAERGVSWLGASVIVDPDGFPVAGPASEDDEELLLAACDLALARDKAISERNDVLADRRPELYGSLGAHG